MPSVSGQGETLSSRMTMPVAPNPFTYGNPISDPSRFFNREREVEQIFSRLRNVEFESTSLVGERRIGKTSLLNHVAHPEVRRSFGLDDDRYAFVYIDLQLANATVTPVRLWQHFLRRISRQYRDPEILAVFNEFQMLDALDNFALADVFDALDAQGQYVVLLLDEFENVTENPNFGPDFFYGMRSLAIHHNLALITSSRRELIELSHSEEVRSSPFFNIFANINVRLMGEFESRELISSPLIDTGITFSLNEVDIVLEAAGYHPYFLQIACYFLYEAYAAGLSSVERLRFVQERLREEAAPHFEDFWLHSDDHEKTLLAAMALLDQQNGREGHLRPLEQLRALYAQSEHTLGRLERRGLIRATPAGYALFCTSFGVWIRRELVASPDDQSRFDEWLDSHRGIMDQLSNRARNELSGILPKISDNYRALIISWASDPRNLIVVADLLRASLGIG